MADEQMPNGGLQNFTFALAIFALLMAWQLGIKSLIE